MRLCSYCNGRTISAFMMMMMMIALEWITVNCQVQLFHLDWTGKAMHDFSAQQIKYLVLVYKRDSFTQHVLLMWRR